MLDREVWISIPGNPKTKGSMKCVGQNGMHKLVESHASATPWLNLLSGWFGRKLASRKAVAGQPVGVECTFTLERPVAHYGTGRNRGILKPRFVDAQPVGHNTGDLDKLARVVADALQKAEILPDDSAVVELVARKAYVQVHPEKHSDVKPVPGVVVRIYPL